MIVISTTVIKHLLLSFFAEDVDENVIDDEKGGKTLQKDLQYLK